MPPSGPRTTYPRTTIRSELDTGRHRLLDEPREHPARVEPFPRELACGARVARVVPRDLAHAVGRLLARREREQPLAGRQHVAEAGVLDDDGAAGREVAGRAAREPA